MQFLEKSRYICVSFESQNKYFEVDENVKSN